MGLNLTRDVGQDNSECGGFYILDEAVNSFSPLYHNFWMPILIIMYSFHMLLNLSTVIHSNFKIYSTSLTFRC